MDILLNINHTLSTNNSYYCVILVLDHLNLGLEYNANSALLSQKKVIENMNSLEKFYLRT